MTILLSLTLFGTLSLYNAPEPLTQMHGHLNDGRTYWVQIDMSQRPPGELNMPGDLQSDEYQLWAQRMLQAHNEAIFRASEVWAIMSGAHQ